MQLSGALALVTGASQGIGAATALELARRGARVVLVARTETKLVAVRELIEAVGGTAWVYPCDVGDVEAVTALAAQVVEAHGVPDLLVNNAGAGRWQAVEETAPGDVVGMMAVPYFAAFHATRAFLPQMLERRSGHIVNVNSPACMVPVPGAAGYAAARSALRTFDKCLQLELRGSGVGVTHFVPGKVSSSYFENNTDSEDRIPSIVTAFVRTISPEDCAVALADAVVRERAEVWLPFMMKSFYYLHQMAPWLVERLAWATAWRRA